MKPGKNNRMLQWLLWEDKKQEKLWKHILVNDVRAAETLCFSNQLRAKYHSGLWILYRRFCFMEVPNLNWASQFDLMLSNTWMDSTNWVLWKNWSVIRQISDCFVSKSDERQWTPPTIFLQQPTEEQLRIGNGSEQNVRPCFQYFVCKQRVVHWTVIWQIFPRVNHRVTKFYLVALMINGLAKPLDG